MTVKAYCGGDEGCGWDGPERVDGIGDLMAEDDWEVHLRDAHGLEFGRISRPPDRRRGGSTTPNRTRRVAR